MRAFKNLLNRKDNENEYGFTLVEILVVIGIIGVVAAIAIPSYIEYKKRATDAAVVSDVTNLSNEYLRIAGSTSATTGRGQMSSSNTSAIEFRVINSTRTVQLGHRTTTGTVSQFVHDEGTYKSSSGVTLSYSNGKICGWSTAGKQYNATNKGYAVTFTNTAGIMTPNITKNTTC